MAKESHTIFAGTKAHLEHKNSDHLDHLDEMKAFSHHLFDYEVSNIRQKWCS